MSDVAVPLAERDAPAVAVAAPQEEASFPELVWAHFKWERALHSDAPVPRELEAHYRATLQAFEQAHGKIWEAYWSTTKPSAVAITIKKAGWPLRWLGKDPSLRFHRATDWVTKEAPEAADVMQRCDTLAIRTSEVLRQTALRIAMQRIFSVASHMLGFLDSVEGKPSDVALRHEAESQTRELKQVKDYYFRAGHNAGRTVYFWGLMIGAAALAVLAPVIALTMHTFAVGTAQLQTFFACYAAGGLGAIVSVLSRMSKADTFTLDFEVGRPSLRRMASFRPFLGAVFGVVTYFVLESGIIETTRTGREQFFYYGTLAFLAGFSERFTKVLLGAAEAGSGAQGQGAKPERERRQTTG
jgi:hypothetical protein